MFRLRRAEPPSPLPGPIELPVSELGLAGAIAALFLLLAWVLSLSSLAI